MNITFNPWLLPRQLLYKHQINIRYYLCISWAASSSDMAVKCMAVQLHLYLLPH